jgi:hypothetical protein
MRLAKKFRRASFFFLPLLLLYSAGNAFGVVVDDYQPEVTARVVRISFIRGDVQIRRAASEDPSEKQEWERAALNLPIVEGDEISTGKDTVVEIQLDSSKHIRLWENAYLKFTTLRDEGIAVSLPQGTMSFRALAFDKAKSYFEIDAPGTTLSIERAGMYRIDAGDTKNGEIRVSTSEGGEAKVYTQTSGFTLRDGRTARIFIEGTYAGDYETSEAPRVPDLFDEWVLQRDAIAAKRLNESFYDKYYDRDQFGAEDLNEYGEWIYTKKYGYVWKPYPNTLSGYADWTPYRYGHWRWVPFYGWTWVNDEPWGWATYHHGRWIWDGSYWVWAPYPYARWRRSWWQPAMISIVTWNGRVLWFPLGYEDTYCDFNRGWGGYRRSRRNVTIINNNTTIIVNPTPRPNNPSPSPSPTQPVLTQEQIRELRRTNAKTPTMQRVPFEAVVGMGAEEFGKQTRGIRTAPVRDAREILIQPIDQNQPPPALPDYKEAKSKMSTEILIQNPRIDDREPVRVKPTGAGKREDGKAMNEKLETERIFGNRTPRTVRSTQQDQTDTTVNPNEPVRRTGAVNRRLPQQKTDTNQSPDFNPQTIEPVRTRRDKSDNDAKQKEEQQQQQQQQEPVRTRRKDDDNPTPIIVQPQQQKEERRPQFPQRQREERREEQQRPQPKPDPKPEPKPQPKQEEQKPSKPTNVDRKADKDS